MVKCEKDVGDIMGNIKFYISLEIFNELFVIIRKINVCAFVT